MKMLAKPGDKRRPGQSNADVDPAATQGGTAGKFTTPVEPNRDKYRSGGGVLNRDAYHRAVANYEDQKRNVEKAKAKATGVKAIYAANPNFKKGDARRTLKKAWNSGMNRYETVHMTRPNEGGVR